MNLVMKNVGNDLQVNTSVCFQCAKCSGGCPVIEEMDILPHQVIHLASLGFKDSILATTTIWICAGCYACAVRCPNGIEIPAVMDSLKHEAVKKGFVSRKPEIQKFHEIFVKDILRRGKAHELRIMGEYNLAIGKPFNHASLAPKMIYKGKLKIFPPKKVKEFHKWIKKRKNNPSSVFE